MNVQPQTNNMVPGWSDATPPYLLTLSAQSEAALHELAARFAEHLSRNPDLPLADACYTASTGRTHFTQRLALTVDAHEPLHERLTAFATGQEIAGLARGQAGRPRIAFLFTGQGAQYPGMARQLYTTRPVFRAALDRCADLLQPLLDRPLLDLLFAETAASDASPLHQTCYTQPALFAVEYALTELWRSWGIVPQALMGHSFGEYVAAVIAGVFSLEDGLRLIAARGQLMQQLPPGGAMAAILAPEARVRAAIEPYNQLAIAAINGPKHTVISGVDRDVAAVVEALAASRVRARRLVVSHAAHSPLMEPMIDAFARVAARIRYAPPRVPIISNVTGRLADETIATPDYWVRHVLAPVQFAAGMMALHAEGYNTFIEIGPHPVLMGMGQSCLPAGTAAWLPSLRRNCDDRQQILESLALLYVAGASVNWEAFHRGGQNQRLELPIYPVQHRLSPDLPDLLLTTIDQHANDEVAALLYTMPE
jgi:acyl transferase domain-containing protein